MCLPEQKPTGGVTKPRPSGTGARTTRAGATQCTSDEDCKGKLKDGADGVCKKTPQGRAMCLPERKPAGCKTDDDCKGTVDGQDGSCLRQAFGRPAKCGPKVSTCKENSDCDAGSGCTQSICRKTQLKPCRKDTDCASKNCNKANPKSMFGRCSDAPACT